MTRFSKVPVTFRARKAVYVCRVCIQDQSFNNFENDTMKLSLNKAKFTGLWAKNCATIRARKVYGPFEKRGPGPLLEHTKCWRCIKPANHLRFNCKWAVRGALQFQNYFSEKSFKSERTNNVFWKGGISIAGKSRKGGGTEKEEGHRYVMHITNMAGFHESYK